jgi:hypothetical protein
MMTLQVIVKVEVEGYYKINLDKFYKVHAIPAHRPPDHFLIVPAIMVFLILVLMIVKLATTTVQPVHHQQLNVIHVLETIVTKILQLETVNLDILTTVTLIVEVVTTTAPHAHHLQQTANPVEELIEAIILLHVIVNHDILTTVTLIVLSAVINVPPV